jgi:hypothetical protein
MLRRMSAKDLGIVNVGRRSPNNLQFLLTAQKFLRAGHTRRPFGMAGAGIAGAFVVGDNFHCDAAMISKNSGRLKL